MKYATESYSFLKHICARSLLVVPALFAQTVSAFQLTYTSQELPFIQGYLGGEPDDSIGSHEAPFPVFSAVFNSSENGLSYNFLSADVNIDFPHATSFSATPGYDSSITFNGDGSIAAWNFFVTFTRHYESIPLEQPPGYNTWTVASSYGLDTCNCDTYWNEFDIYTPRQENWAYVNTIKVLFGAENTTSNWHYEATEVPEPMTPLLLLTGLGLLSAARLRNKKFNSN